MARERGRPRRPRPARRLRRHGDRRPGRDAHRGARLRRSSDRRGAARLGDRARRPRGGSGALLEASNPRDRGIDSPNPMHAPPQPGPKHGRGRPRHAPRPRAAFAGRRMHALLVATALLATVAFVALRPVGGSRAATTRHPPVVAATRFHTRWPIKHVVFILKENRSFDHMFGTFPGAAGATTGLEWGKTVPLTKTTDQRMIDADN